jgi:hypothetical protein
VWYDGCNEWTLSVFAVVAGLFLLGAVAFGVVSLLKRQAGGTPGSAPR